MFYLNNQNNNNNNNNLYYALIFNFHIVEIAFK